MKKIKMRKLCAITLALALGMTTMVGCGEKDSGSAVKQEISYNLATEVKTIDPTLNNANDGSIVICNAFEGLYKTDKSDKAEPGIAKSCDVSSDGLTYTFHLRDDAKWSDGQQVTAKDFAYSWKRGLDPKTAADYAYQLYYIKGAEAYNTGKGSADALGIKVIDDLTLEVTLEKPTTYFLELTAFATYMPLREDIVSAHPNDWTADPSTYVTNGAFKMQEYNMKDSYVFVKNDNYYDKDSVKLDKLTFKMITDSTSAYAALKNGEITGIDVVPTAEIENGQKDGYIKVFPALATYFYCLNVGNKSDKLDSAVKTALSKKEVRKALNLTIDRKKITDEIVKGGRIPAYSFVPDAIEIEGEKFSDKQYWDPNKVDVEAAKKLLADAGYPNGEGLPTFELKYNNNVEYHKSIAEAIQQMWAQIGVKVVLKSEEWTVFQDSRKNGNYEVARHSWVGDYVDPMTFLDMWTTGSGQNDAKFSNPKYDELIKKAQVEKDAKTRAGYLKEAEAILMDELPILPIYYDTYPKGFDPKIKDYRVSPLGQIYFTKAYMSE
ncbi:peptide ABC transporter substrate-binding protein [Clostridium sp. SHJSY1]|uniref:peptide ABC transporter substrate-binding protein n=1 Tax=Clostridium sp. SHJSY1 TaxID=2942483 RepID=UPI0028766423|nr:peptide ABC transporter substrate-binding protein [Clostridium sp. SHJSY1]MDS0527501.1 peptide ABC transporter substrate-binding protein [Clostridium sp. SHJSY1]